MRTDYVEVRDRGLPHGCVHGSSICFPRASFQHGTCRHVHSFSFSRESRTPLPTHNHVNAHACGWLHANGSDVCHHSCASLGTFSFGRCSLPTSRPSFQVPILSSLGRRPEQPRRC